ncbi:b2707364-5b90-458d-a729-c6cb5d7aed9b [Thermothielavioides terrestris]|uniref:B2707364-5b90-458d-a729-c6cb5d7aed9b n=1 Tax=Thermothielavioides terrestris TaxID=2587410 RepID=A0A446BYV1_9PEZI|nr:b2707364-5b90-458d-a729-c6cb5d7aed9b [Thermothielavioides terrestris]
MGGVVTQKSESNSYNGTATPPKQGPVRYGFLLPRAFDVMDVFAPLDILQALSRQTHLELAMLGRTLEPVSTAPVSAAMNRFNSSFFPSVVPTHTYDDDPPLDVLIVPGGAAARSPDLGPELAYIRKVFPKLQYLITICTGAGIAAQSGVLDGHRATTNKAAWSTITPMGPNVKWVSPARWVEDGKVWTSSGVTAGLDLTFAFVRAKYENGTAIADAVAGTMEHVMDMDWRDDKGFGAKYNVPVQN